MLPLYSRFLLPCCLSFSFLFLALTSLHATPLKSIVIEGRITDASTGEMLAGVNVSVKNIETQSQQGATSNQYGYFRIVLNLNPKSQETIELQFSHLGYEMYSVTLPSKRPKPLKIELKQKQYELKEVQVWASPKGVYGSAQYYLVDFELHNGYLFVLANVNWDKDPVLLVMDSNEQLLYTHRIPGKPKQLSLDCSNHLFVFTETKCFEVGLDTNTVYLRLADHPMQWWIKNHCLARNANDHIYRLDSNYGYKQDFYRFDSVLTQHFLLRSIQDRQQSRRKNDEADFLAANNYRMDQPGDYELPLNMQLRDPIQQHHLDRSRSVESQFGERFILRAKENPMFYVDDRIYFFNHVDHQLEVMDLQGKPIFQTRTFYDRKVSWGQKIIQDPVSKRIYTYFSGWNKLKLVEFDLVTGKLKDGTISSHHTSEKVRFYDGEAFYLYRSIENPLKMRLARISMTTP